MSTLSVQSTVGELVAQRPSRSRVFEELGIDYCCGGKQTLEAACAGKGLDAAAVLTRLDDSVGGPFDGADKAAGDPDCRAMSFTDLTGLIERTHHAYLRRELPRLEGLIRRVHNAHGPRHAELAELAEVFAAFQSELGQHMMKEEQILFPMLRQLDGAAARPAFHCGSVGNPIRVMEFEHDNAGQALARMRTLTGDYTAPADACNTWRAMLDALRGLEADMHQHVHKENSILFPRALEAEAKLVSV